MAETLSVSSGVAISLNRNCSWLLLHLVGYLYYWQMGFNSVFKGLKYPHLQNLFL